MISQYLIFVAFAPIGISISIGIAIFAWRRRTVPGARGLAWCAVVTFGLADLQHARGTGSDRNRHTFWAKVTYILVGVRACGVVGICPGLHRAPRVAGAS